jgi:hypothetical protein
MRNALFWVITATNSGNFLLIFRFSIPEGGTDRLSRNVGKKLPLLGTLRNDIEERSAHRTNHSKLGNVW